MRQTFPSRHLDQALAIRTSLNGTLCRRIRSLNLHSQREGSQVCNWNLCQTAQDYHVDTAADGQQGNHMGIAGNYDLMILDLHLSKLHGI